VRRRVTVIVHDNDFTDLAACTFWLEAGQPLSGYQVKLYTTKAWTNATFSVYPASIDTSQWILLDDVSLSVTPSAPLTGTECLEPIPGAPAGAFRTAGTLAADPVSGRDAPSSGGASRPGGQTNPAQGGREGGQPVWQAVPGEGGARAHLWRTPIDLREASAPRLAFDSQLADGASDAFVEVTRDGVNWIRLAAVPPTAEWASVTVDLSAFEGDVVYVRFVYDGVEAWAVRGIRIDDGLFRTPHRSR
jgi:hypothetical protein